MHTHEIWRTHKERGVQKVVVQLSVFASICVNSYESYRCSCILPAVLSLTDIEDYLQCKNLSILSGNWF